jgi:hypothetical protein
MEIEPSRSTTRVSLKRYHHSLAVRCQALHTERRIALPEPLGGRPKSFLTHLAAIDISRLSSRAPGQLT